jgi:hypothetical protein
MGLYQLTGCPLTGSRQPGDEVTAMLGDWASCRSQTASINAARDAKW